MIKQIILSITLLCLSSISIANDESDIMSLIQNYADAINGSELNMDLAKKVWSQSPELTFIHPRGHQRGWQEVEEQFYYGAMGFFSHRELTVKDVNIVMLSNDTAWAEFYWDFEATMKNGTPLTTAGRETQILKRESDGWKIMHVHYSGMPTQEEGEGF